MMCGLRHRRHLGEIQLECRFLVLLDEPVIDVANKKLLINRGITETGLLQPLDLLFGM